MSKNSGCVLMVMFACLCLVRIAAAADDQLGLAASDPSQVPSIVTAMEAKAVPDFAGQVMQAAAKMPISPRRRLAQMRDIAVEFAKAVPAAELPALLAQLVVNTPFQMLPGWVEAFKPLLAAQLKPIDDNAYAKLAAGVLKEIGGAETLTDEDKTIFTTFAMVLLARGKTPEEEQAFAASLLDALRARHAQETTQLGREAACSRLKTALGNQPDSPDLYFALGNLYAQQSRWSEAQQAYFRAYAGDPDNADFLFNLAVSLDHLHQNKLAAQYYQMALKTAEANGSTRPVSFDRIQVRARISELQP